MNYEDLIREMMELDSRTKTDYEDYRRFMLGVAHNRINSESRLLGVLYVILKELVKNREENRIDNNTTVDLEEDEYLWDTLDFDDYDKTIDDKRKTTFKEKVTKESVLRALKNNNGCRALAAKELGCSEKTIYNRLKK